VETQKNNKRRVFLIFSYLSPLLPGSLRRPLIFIICFLGMKKKGVREASREDEPFLF